MRIYCSVSHLKDYCPPPPRKRCDFPKEKQEAQNSENVILSSSLVSLMLQDVLILIPESQPNCWENQIQIGHFLKLILAPSQSKQINAEPVYSMV